MESSKSVSKYTIHCQSTQWIHNTLSVHCQYTTHYTICNTLSVHWLHKHGMSVSNILRMIFQFQNNLRHKTHNYFASLGHISGIFDSFISKVEDRANENDSQVLKVSISSDCFFFSTQSEWDLKRFHCLGARLHYSGTISTYPQDEYSTIDVVWKHFTSHYRTKWYVKEKDQQIESKIPAPIYT